MAKKARSKWFRYLRTSSTTSIMEPALFRVPSTLQMGIGLKREVVCFDIRTVNEHPGGPRIQERLHCSGLSSVSGLEFNV